VDAPPLDIGVPGHQFQRKLNPVISTNFMASNYFNATWRRLFKDIQFTLLNLIGLSIGMACFLLIFLWVSDELSVDSFHIDKDRLYEIMAHIKLPDGTHTQNNTPYRLSRSLAKEMPGVEDAVCLQTGFEPGTLSFQKKHILTTRYFADSDFFKMFSFHLVDGNPNTVLGQKYSVVISDKMSMELFKTTENVIGKKIQWENDAQPYTVSGIFKEPGSNSSLQFDVLFTYDLFYDQDPDASDWANSNPISFLLLNKAADPKKIENKLTGFLHAKYSGSPLTLSMRKFDERYLYDHYNNGVQSGGRIRYVKLFSLIAVFVLMIACINFMNLSTAKTAQRMKQTGIKKLLGAGRARLIFQYISESMVMAFAALLVALLLALLLLPQFNRLTGKHLSLPLTFSFVEAMICISTVTGLLAGIYPALYLSGFKPINALKGKLSTAGRELWLRRGLVVFQYTFSIIFIVAVVVIYKQMNLIRTIDLGYRRENIICFSNERKINEHYSAFASAVEKVPGVTAISSMDGNFHGRSSGSTEHAKWQGQVPGTQILFSDIDIDFGLTELMDIKMQSGRSFSRDFSTDSLAIMVNEAAVNAMGIKDPLGKWFEVWGGKYHIIGVTKDFHFESLYEKVKPCFMRCNPGARNILVKINGGMERKAIEKLSVLYKTFNPDLDFKFSFLDKDYETMYVAEERESVLLRWFAALAIIISCLGLFGLAAFSAQKRQKEMSIRKIVGASTGDIAGLLSKDFFQLVLLATGISVPLSWWIMNQWLSNFAYRVHVDAGIFLLTIAWVMGITLLTISFQSLKAALANPIHVLRSA
jgi:putative ABC transport system permease protein